MVGEIRPPGDSMLVGGFMFVGLFGFGFAFAFLRRDVCVQSQLRKKPHPKIITT